MMRVDLESRLKAIDRQIERSEREAKTASEKTDAAIRRMDKAELRMEKFDRRLEATGKIIQFGMKMLVESQQRHKEMDFKISAPSRPKCGPRSRTLNTSGK